jgi:hypothetical protein
MMVGLDLEMPPNEIWAPSLNYMKDGHHLFLIGGFSQIVITQLLIGECQGTPFLHQDTPRPLLEASHSKTKVLVKYRHY